MKLALAKMAAANPFDHGTGFRAASAVSHNGDTLAVTAGAAAVGGTAGGIGAYELSENAINSQPAHSVTVSGDQVTIDGQTHTSPQNYETPILEDKVIGKVPETQYQPTIFGGWGAWWPQDVNMKDVHATDYGGYPKLDADGKAIMQEQTKTFNGHGNPVVDWQTHNAQIPYQDPNHPYSWSSVADQSCYYHDGEYHPGYNDPGYYDSNGNYHEGEYHSGYNDPGYQVCHTNGYWVYFDPNIQYKPVETEAGGTTYQTPDVHFENGVHTALNTTLGAVGGFALAGLAAYLIKSAMSR